jgi:hypothetical protein
MIAQYYFSPTLSGMLCCVRTEKPCLVLVTPSFTQSAHAPTAWNRFIYRGSRLLSREYERALEQETKTGAIEVFALRDSCASSECSGRVRPATRLFATA